MEGKYHGELVNDSTISPLIAALKKVAREHVYRGHEILQLEVMGRRVIGDLMDLFWEGAEECDEHSGVKNFTGKIYKLISKNYRTVCEQALKRDAFPSVPSKYHRLQLVTDQ